MAERHWLMKTEPDWCSIEDLENGRVKAWKSIRNYASRNNMRAMTVGDAVLIYHSGGKEPGVVGLASVAREAYPDPLQWDADSPYFDAKSTRDAPRWDRVDVQLLEPLPRKVSLTEIKAEDELVAMELLRQSRLSVSPVRPEEFGAIVSLAGGG